MSKRTGLTEAIQDITRQKARASGAGRRAEENPLDNFWRPEPPDDPHDVRTDAARHNTYPLACDRDKMASEHRSKPRVLELAAMRH